MPEQTPPGRWFHRLRISVRAIMIIVLVLGAAFGWLAYLAREAQIQRDAVIAVTKLGGSVTYDWQYENGNIRVRPGTNTVSEEVPHWPKWVVDRLGVEAFGSVTQVSFRGLSGRRTSADLVGVLAHVGQLSRLKYLSFIRMPVNDAGLAHLKGLSSLESLMLRGRNEVTDAGIVHLARMNSLKGLYLENSKISDEGLASVSKLTGLETLNLARTQIGDAGLAHLDRLTCLENIGLDGTRVTDAGLVRLLRGRTRFKGLYLSDTQIGDDGLAPLESVTSLGSLLLRNTRVSDAGLAHL